MRIIQEYEVKRAYNGKIIRVRVCEGFEDNRNVTLLYCSKYHPFVERLENASCTRVLDEIELLFKIAETKIDEKGFVKILKKKFK